MADVTRWEIVTFAWRDRPSDDVMEQDDDGLWVKYTDHLAALERVRVETLRELDKQLAKAMELLDGDPAVIGLRRARFAIAALRKPEVEG